EKRFRGSQRRSESAKKRFCGSQWTSESANKRPRAKTPSTVQHGELAETTKGVGRSCSAGKPENIKRQNKKSFCLEYIQHIQTEMTEFNANHVKIIVKQSQETEEYIAKKYYEHLALAESNYEAAWKILQERYDNLRLQFTTQVRLVLMGLN
ncbi:unnamed protein product, partial [Ceratitis capitata]